MKKLIIASIILIGIFLAYKQSKKIDFNSDYQVGDVLDSLNHVKVYYNGGVSNVEERNTVEGYNIGLKYQCVEFVKRYYFEYYNHRMHDTYGNAKDFFNSNLQDGEINIQRDLIQYSHPSNSKPQVGDLIIFDGTVFNKFGHVAIISNVTENEIEIIQQNPGPFGNSREKYSLNQKNNLWEIGNEKTLGWLRLTSN